MSSDAMDLSIVLRKIRYREILNAYQFNEVFERKEISDIDWSNFLCRNDDELNVETKR